MDEHDSSTPAEQHIREFLQVWPGSSQFLGGAWGSLGPRPKTNPSGYEATLKVEARKQRVENGKWKFKC